MKRDERINSPANAGSAEPPPEVCYVPTAPLKQAAATICKFRSDFLSDRHFQPEFIRLKLESTQSVQHFCGDVAALARTRNTVFSPTIHEYRLRHAHHEAVLDQLRGGSGRCEDFVLSLGDLIDAEQAQLREQLGTDALEKPIVVGNYVLVFREVFIPQEMMTLADDVVATRQLDLLVTSPVVDLVRQFVTVWRSCRIVRLAGYRFSAATTISATNCEEIVDDPLPPLAGVHEGLDELHRELIRFGQLLCDHRQSTRNHYVSLSMPEGEPVAEVDGIPIRFGERQMRALVTLALVNREEFSMSDFAHLYSNNGDNPTDNDVGAPIRDLRRALPRMDSDPKVSRQNSKKRRVTGLWFMNDTPLDRSALTEWLEKFHDA